MRRIIYGLVGLMLVTATASAIDINPSKNNQPPSFWTDGGSHFSIFNGDPKRIQRANEVNAKAFDTKVEIAPTSFSLKAVKAVAPNPSIKLTFSVHNHSPKKTYTLSFPNAERWDFRILDPSGAAIYVYSDNCEFEQKIGSSMVNPDDRLVYVENVEFDDMKEPIAPGVYIVQAVLSNYPEMHAQAQITVQP